MERDRASSVLANSGPCSSPELAGLLVAQLNVSSVLARKLISRSKTIKKLAHLPLPKRARFVYLQKHYGSPLFWERLIECLLEHSASYGSGLAALVGRSGMMPVRHFLIACGSPVAQKKRIPGRAVLERLRAAELVRIFEVSGIGECVELIHQAQPSAHEITGMKARLKAEQLLLSAVKDWARKLGFASYEKVQLRDEQSVEDPMVGPFLWDMTGPSYLGPLASWGESEGKPKPGFVVCDVLAGSRVSVATLKPFINKCSTVRAMPNIGRCLQMFIADDFDGDALRLARERGIVAATVEALFGAEVARSLRNLAEILKEVVPTEGSVSKLDEIFRRLNHIEGAANNLRGALFEYMVAEVQRLIVPHDYIQINEIFKLEGRAAEVDVVVFQRRRIARFIECKGYKPSGPLPDDLVEHWLLNRVPLIDAVVSQDIRYKDCSREYEFWTSGKLSAEARAMVKRRGDQLSRYSIRAYDCEDLPRLMNDTGSASLRASFREHFQNHPLSQVDRMALNHGRQLPRVAAPRLSTRDAPEEF